MEYNSKFSGSEVDKLLNQIRKIDSEVTPTSENLVTSKAIYEELTIRPFLAESVDSESDFCISDEKGFVVCEFKEGHIRTKMFDSRNSGSGAARVENNTLIF